MSFVKLFDRVLLSTTTTGTGIYSLGSAVAGYQDFAGGGANSGDLVSYVAVDDLSAPTNWEIGEGVWTAGSPATLSRATIIASTNGGLAVSWGAGTRYIFSTPNGLRLQEAANSGAQGADIASAATTDLSKAAGYTHITGTTTITSFGTVAAGARRLLEFAGSLTLTHNATSLILPAGVDISTRAGDVFEFTSEGSGNWRCTRTPLTNSGGSATAPVTVSNTTVQTALANFTIKGGTLGKTRMVELIAWGEFTNNTGGNQTIQITGTYGGTSVVNTGAQTFGTAVNSHVWRLALSLAAVNATNAQNCFADFRVSGAGVVNSTMSISSDFAISGEYNSITEDSTVDKSLFISVALGSASASLTCVLREAFVRVTG